MGIPVNAQLRERRVCPVEHVHLVGCTWSVVPVLLVVVSCRKVARGVSSAPIFDEFGEAVNFVGNSEWQTLSPLPMRFA